MVNPVKAFAPERVRVPPPLLVKAPEVLVDAPLTVKLLVVMSKIPVWPVVMVNARFVLAVAPV